MQTNIIHHGDCTEHLNHSLEPGSIDLIFADPPYNLSGNALKWVDNQTGGPWFMMNENWDRMSKDDYIDFTFRWIKGCNRVLKPTGSIYVACSYHNIGEVIVSLKQLNFQINNVITWYKSNAMPNMTRRTFTHSTEFVVWGTKGKGWCFNYDVMRSINPEKQKNGESKQMRDVWQIPLVQGRERLRGDDGRALHPTQKPEEMLKRIILASSNVNDIVLDPFMGSGTTACVAEKFSRQWIGIEREKQYIEIALARLEAEVSCLYRTKH